MTALDCVKGAAEIHEEESSVVFGNVRVLQQTGQGRKATASSVQLFCSMQSGGAPGSGDT